jgi:tripartite-type tricarboxylate transporter receptor subunit TctC
MASLLRRLCAGARVLCGSAALIAATLGLAQSALAQTYPTRPITIVVAYAPGAASDLIGRTVGEQLQAMFGQTVIIDNRAGAGGNVGAAYAARQPADGYTIMVGTDAMLTSNVYLYKDTPFNPAKDFAPITNVGSNVIALTINSASMPNVNTIPDFIAYAKANPGKLSFGSSGAASPHHLAGELLKQKASIDIMHVPYKGGGAAANDLIGGHIPMAFLSLSSAIPAMGSGKVKMIGVVDKTRYAGLPDVPAIAETLPGFEMSSWLGFFAPAGTPEPIVAKLNEAIIKIIRSDAVKGKFAALGLSVIGSTPGELVATVRDGLDVRGQLVKTVGIQPE